MSSKRRSPLKTSPSRAVLPRIEVSDVPARIEISHDEVLDDLLYPAPRPGRWSQPE
jgi:hypothetical protein